MADGGSGAIERVGLRGALVRLALLTALLGAVVWLLTRLVPGAGQRLANARPGWVAVEIVLETIACIGYAVLFHATFSYGACTLPPRRSAEIALGELGAFAVVPTGIGGPVLRFWSLRRLGMSLRTAIVRSISHGVIFQIPYVAAAAALGTGVALALGPGHAPLGLALAPLGIVLGTLALAGLAMIVARGHRRGRPGRFRTFARAAMRVVPDGIREVPGRLRNPGSLLGATAFWAGDSAVLWAAFHAAGGSPPVGVVVLAYMLGQLGNLLPLPGGVGGVEPLMLGVLSASGAGGATGAAAVVLYRIVSLGIQGTLGALAVALLVPALRRGHHDRAE